MIIYHSSDWWRIYLDLFKSSGTFQYISEYFGIFPDILEPSRPFQNILDPSGTFHNIFEPSRTFWNILEPFRTFGNIPEYPQTCLKCSSNFHCILQQVIFFDIIWVWEWLKFENLQRALAGPIQNVIIQPYRFKYVTWLDIYSG